MIKKITRGFTVKEVYKNLFYVLTYTLVFGFILYSCTTPQSPGPTTPEVGLETVTTAPFTSDFEDIPIPTELKKDLSKSFIYETPFSKTAIIYYDSFPGYIDHSSLIIYFKTNMAAQGWKLIDLYNYKEANLSFEKGDRRCHITIFDKFLQTKVVIKVGQMSQSEPVKEKP
jgi:hypothetical protein